jgi:hypothetical protein
LRYKRRSRRAAPEQTPTADLRGQMQRRDGRVQRLLRRPLGRRVRPLGGGLERGQLGRDLVEPVLARLRGGLATAEERVPYRSMSISWSTIPGVSTPEASP